MRIELQDQFNIEDLHFIDNKKFEKVEMFQVLILKQGRAEVRVDFDIFELSAPAVVFISEYQLFEIIPKNSVHASLLRFSKEFFCIKLHRKETFCDAVLFNTSETLPYLSNLNSSSESIFNLLNDLRIEMNSDHHSLWQDVLITKLKLFLLMLSREKLKIETNNRKLFTEITLDFQNLLEKEHTNQHSVQFYADQLHISPKRLNEVLKNDLEKTCSELIKEKLIVEAKRELYQNKKSIKQISFDLGFEDPAYFSRFFKKQTNLSPLNYLNIHLAS